MPVKKKKIVKKKAVKKAKKKVTKKANKLVKKPKSSVSDFDTLYDKVMSHIGKNSPVEYVILKGHMMIEYYLNQIMVWHFKDAYQKTNMSFYSKLQEAEKLKILSPANISAIRALNRLRNKLSHELHYVMTESDIDSIGFSVGKEYLKDKYKHESDTRELLKITTTRLLVPFSKYIEKKAR
jgi:hypothetical protein